MVFTLQVQDLSIFPTLADLVPLDAGYTVRRLRSGGELGAVHRLTDDLIPLRLLAELKRRPASAELCRAEIRHLLNKILFDVLNDLILVRE